MTSAPASEGLSRLKSRLRLPFALLTAAFVGWTGWRLALRWDSSEVSVSWGLVAAAVVPILGVTLLHAVGWVVLVRKMSGTTVPMGRGVELILSSQLGRYLPAKVGMPLIRLAGTEALGLPASVMLSSTALEVLTYTATGGVVAFGALAATGVGPQGELSFLGQWSVPLVIVFVVGTLALMIVDRRHLPARVRKIAGDQGRGPLLPAVVPFFFIGVWASWFAHGYILILAVGGDPATALGGAPLFVLAPVAGFLAIAAPGGIGVREAVVSVGLAPAIGPAPALAAAVVSRVASLGMDAGVWGAARLLGLHRVQPAEHRGDADP